MKYLFIFISSIIFAQQTKSADFKEVAAELTVNPSDKSVSGSVRYKFKVLKPVDTIKIDAQNMTFSEVVINDKKVPFYTNGKQLFLIYTLKKSTNYIGFKYKALPKQAFYFVGKEESDNLQIWTQGQGKYTSHWFPSFDDVNEKMIFSVDIDFDSKYKVISNGILTNTQNNLGNTHWKYKMKKPMSSYLLLLAIGQFDKKSVFSESGIPLEMYYEPNTTANFESTYRFSKEIFDFFEHEIGVKYPWEIYKQIPARDFLYGGMENTSATLFSSRYVVDNIGYADRNYINVNAHELAHQWFGNLVTAASGKDHWLQEGFATYYALLAEQKLFGDDYFYFELENYAKLLTQAVKTDTIPILNPKASSLTYYQKGAWALHVLREGTSEKAFKKAVKNYLTKHAFQTVTTQDFFEEIKKVSNYDVVNFSKLWLDGKGFDIKICKALLQKNKSIQKLYEVEKVEAAPLSSKNELFKNLLKSDLYFGVKKAIIAQLEHENYNDKKELLRLGLATNNVLVRQEIAASLNVIPEDFRADYEKFLDDKSYQTQEIALYKLWQNFPNRQATYLEKSKNWVGFNDYNLKVLWLFLAIDSQQYPADKETLIAELKKFSSVKYEAATRQNALEKLLALDLKDNTVLKELVNATTHHYWLFSKFARERIRILLKNSEVRHSFQSILPILNENEQVQLQRLLKE